MTTQLNPKLMALPADALLKLKIEVDAAYQARRYQFLQVGREATFKTTKRPTGVCRIKITGFGPKNVTGYEIDETGAHMMHAKWRVAPELLTPYIPPPKPAPMPKGVGDDAPQHAMSGSF